MRFLIVDECPCPASVAPYIYIVLRNAGQTASSVYRGSDAAAILHAHHKHTQAELARIMPDRANPEGFSQHDLHSDGGPGNPHVQRGARLEDWQVGVDSGTNDQDAQDAITAAARKHGWHVKHPYKRGVELHHWCFSTRPRPKSPAMCLRVLKLRVTLPRR